MKLLLTGAFSYTAKQIEELKEIAGEVIFIQDERVEITVDVSDIDMVVCNGLFLYHPIEEFKKLKFIQLTSAGFDRIPMEYIEASGIQVENAKGVYSIPMAEWVILMILQFYKKSKIFHLYQSYHEWIKRYDLLELSGKTAIIVGFGSVGKEIAKRLQAFHISVIGIDVSVMETDQSDEFYAIDALDQVLHRADILVLALPITKETHHLINSERLSKLKSSCILINVSRGELIDENALIKALLNNGLNGVALDVFEEEPLNSNSPLWDFENVIITPHNSYVSDKISERLYSLIRNNIRSFISQYNKPQAKEENPYREEYHNPKIKADSPYREEYHNPKVKADSPYREEYHNPKVKADNPYREEYHNPKVKAENSYREKHKKPKVKAENSYREKHNEPKAWVEKPYRYCIVTTMSSSIDNWITPFLPLYHAHGFDLTVIANMTAEYQEELLKRYPYVKAIPIPMPRGVDFCKSVKAIKYLYRVLKKGNYNIVQFSTPNASFYTAIASFLAGIPIRLYCQWGMVHVTMKGLKRSLFQMIERTTCLLSTQVQPDSYGNLAYCRKRAYYSRKKSSVIWYGSAKGVDLNKFDVSKKESYRREIRSRYGIKEDSIVLGFVGRLGREKGCIELFEGFKRLEADYPNLILLFVGPIEKEDSIAPELLDWFYQNQRIIKTNRVPDIEKHMAAMDIFILPSHREGFGMSVVEAQAMEVPVIVSNIPGPVNAMLDGVTGIKIPVRDIDALVAAVEELLRDEDKRDWYGKAGHKFVKKHFDARIFSKKLINNRIRLVKGSHENISSSL